MRVREKPPLKVSIEAQSPSGRYARWASDESRAENAPSGLRWSSTMPGGFESLDATLPRKPGVSYDDLDRLTTLRVLSATTEVVGEYRLERTPRASGDHVAVSPGAVGLQAHLDDDKSAQMIYIDQALAGWAGPSADRRADLLGAGYGPQDASTLPGNPPVLQTALNGAWDASHLAISEATYDAGIGNRIGRLLASWDRQPAIDAADTLWYWDAVLADDDVLASLQSTGNLRAAGPGAVILPANSTARRYALLRLWYNAAGGADNASYAINWSQIAVIGDHGLPVGSFTDDAGSYYGIVASDVVRDALARFCPLLNVTDESVAASTFLIPQLTFPTPTTASEIVRQASRFGLEDWAVWEDRTFWWHPRGARGRTWRARIAPAQLDETGPQLDRLWESVIVQYQDVDGSTRTVGPPGSGAGTESPYLKDTDPDNPANRLGITRRSLLTMGIATPSRAIEVGWRFLSEQKLLDSSGRAQLVGHVEDDRGVLHPYHHVRAGDQISFVDAADPSPRRIVRADHSDDTRTCSIDIDAPPEGLAALLERLGVGLVLLGL